MVPTAASLEDIRRQAIAAEKASEFVQAADLYGALVQAAGDDDASAQAMDDRAHQMRALLKLGRYADAGAVCDAIIRLDPANEPALIRLSRIWERLGRADLAADYARRAAEASPASIDNQWNWALSAHNAGRDEEAERAIQAVLTLNPQHPDALLAQKEWSEPEGDHARPTAAAFASLQTFVRERQIAESGRRDRTPPPITLRPLIAVTAGSLAFMAIYLSIRILLIG